MSSTIDGSESVDQFLARIASLREKRDGDEEERSKRLEQDLAQSRRERQARRLERARSLSPSKTGPLPSPSRNVAPQPLSSRSIDPPVTLTPTSPARSNPKEDEPSSMSMQPPTTFGASRPLPAQPACPSTTPPPANATVTSLARSGTLSWQQRPSSRDGSPVRSRPVSGFATMGRNVARSESPQLGNNEMMTREEIAQSLSSKDPTWFRQTEDRGVGSTALRRGAADEEAIPTFLSKSMKLPGLTAQRRQPGSSLDLRGWASGEPQDQQTDTTSSQNDASRPLSSAPDFASAAATSISPTIPQKDPSESPKLNTPPSLNRTSSVLYAAGRPPSPTKGLGGFVESAMMKRSDSVSKRWNVQAGGSLRRGDSVASNRGSFHALGSGASALGHTRTLSREPRGGKDQTPSSPHNNSRPASSHGIEVDGKSRPVAVPSPAPVAANDEQVEDSLLARSPSKTMDPRRWSPTKASWLESALSKPVEPPKQSSPKSDQPQWVVDRQNSRSGQTTKAVEKPDALLNNPALVSMTSRGPQTTNVRMIEEHVVDKEIQGQNEELRSKRELKNARLVGDIISQAGDSSNESQKSAVDAPAKLDAGSKTKIGPKPVSRAPDEVRRASRDREDTLSPPPEQSRAESENPPTSKPLRAETVEKKPPVVKPKPQTPPRTDFRANLKPRQVDNTGGKAEEPEFKAAFGKLKRTQTQNYVAPDDLRDNITRGKAALAQTGGPIKSKRVDEFKDSILQKKEAMKASHVQGKPTPGIPAAEKAAPVVPEALARRKTLHKTTTPETNTATQIKPISLNSRRPEQLESKIEVPQTISASAPATPEVKAQESITENVRSKPRDQLSSEPLKKSFSIPVESSATSTKPAEESQLEKSRSLPSPPTGPLQKMWSEPSKLAARLNPALAGIISRTGSPKPMSAAASSESLPALAPSTSGIERQSEANASEDLNHMTKVRAKGPKRRAPKSDQTGQSKQAIVHSEEPRSSSAAGIGLKAATQAIPKSDSITSVLELYEEKRPEVAMEADISAKQKKAQLPSPQKPPASTQRNDNRQHTPPVVAAKSPELRKVSSPPVPAKPVSSTLSSKTATQQPFNIAADMPASETSVPKTESHKPVPKSLPLTPKPLTPSGSKVNSPKQFKPTPEEGKPSTPSKPTNKPSGLGLNLSSSPSLPSSKRPILTPPPETQPTKRSGTSIENALQKSNKGSSEVEAFLQSFFTTLPSRREKAEFNTESFLTSRSAPPDKMKTLSMQIWEVGSGGKRTSLPPQQEHILYEDCMFLCIHSFEYEGRSQSSEAYLWQGDNVSEAAAEDAQLFCRKVARDNSAKLEVVRQGKEHSRFFSALGGIAIIRRSKSSAFYMLCGRRHLGHIAFDEVDLSMSNLCSGFPYIISAKFGKLFLWKGQGSSADEVGAARLIGMDLGLTGEIEEIAEGEETPAFWDVFPTSKTDRHVWSESWLWRADHRCFPSTLYRIEHERPKSSSGFLGWRTSSPPKTATKAVVDSISPHCQRDLDPYNIYVLDAYLDIFVFVGEKAASKSAEFVSAQEIALDMSLLLVSLEGRSLLPNVLIVFGEPPRDFQAAFRKWTSTTHPHTKSSTNCYKLDDVRPVLGY